MTVSAGIFLEKVLKLRGFSNKWIKWINSIVRGGKICVRINDQNSSYFVTGKGLRQGDPLSPLLFNLVADVFTKMLERAADEGLIKGLLTEFTPEGVISLQYADNTILFLDSKIEYARNLKWILCCFEQISGMKINFHKSDLLAVNMEDDDVNEFAYIFCCKRSSFPMKYLGVPLHYDKLRKEDL